MDYNEVMNYINNTARFGSNLGLTRTYKLLELLGNPHEKLKCIHIAGTNGKGSTVSMISEMLIESGYKVGMYISPYIEDFEERMQINNQNIKKEDLVVLINRVKEKVDEIIESGFEHPTQFEIITCAMYLYFYENNVDYAVIEVGMGGRLDSTNVINPILTIITSISFDHMQVLGDTLPKIAKEKAGIIKNNVPLILYPQQPSVCKVIEEICLKNNSEIIKVKKDNVIHLGNLEIKKNDGRIVKAQKLQIKTLNNTYIIESCLLGKHQMYNCAVVVNAYEKLLKLGLKITKTAFYNSFKNVIWPVRLEIMQNNPYVVLDGAHNIDGIINLSESIDKYFKYDKLILILGILADKEVESMIKVISKRATKILTVTPNSDRAELSTDLKNEVLKYNKNCEDFLNYKDAYLKALSYCKKDDLLLICGSLYMVGDMRKIIKNLKGGN